MTDEEQLQMLIDAANGIEPQPQPVVIDMIDPCAKSRNAWQVLTRPAADPAQARASWLAFLNLNRKP